MPPRHDGRKATQRCSAPIQIPFQPPSRNKAGQREYRRFHTVHERAREVQKSSLFRQPELHMN